MKKLLLLAIGLVLFVPAVVKANTTTLTFECTPAQVFPGGTRTCTLFATTSDNMSAFNATVTPKGSKTTITGISVAAGWNAASRTPENISLTAQSAMTGRFPILTITYMIHDDWQEGEECGITLVQTGNPIPVVDTPRPAQPGTTVENPQTGPNSIPYIIIGAGAVIALGAFYIATRKNKFYKI